MSDNIIGEVMEWENDKYKFIFQQIISNKKYKVEIKVFDKEGNGIENILVKGIDHRVMDIVKNMNDDEIKEMLRKKCL